MKLTHPATGQVIECRADAVAVYVSQGWQPVQSRIKPPETTSVDGPTPRQRRSK